MTALHRAPFRPADTPVPPRPAPSRLLRNYSIEVTPRDLKAVAACRDHVWPGAEVAIAFAPGEQHRSVVKSAAALQRAGFLPVPHIAARSFAGFTRLNDFLARLAGEAGVTRALVIGGDVDRPAGPYESSLKLLETGLFQKHGLRRIGLACYPEAHRKIGAARLEAALADKLALLAREEMTPWLVTQFCFEPAPILQRIAALRAAGIVAPLRIGIAGPASRRTLWKYALHCGLGSSIRRLGTRVDTVANLLAGETPDALLDAIAGAAALPAADIGGVHLFSFGGVAETARWANAMIARRPGDG